MALSKEKVEELLKELEDAGLSATKAKDIEGLLTHYHPDAVVIHKGVKAYYGQNEIREFLREFFQSVGDNEELLNPKFNPLYSSSSTDGEYLIRRGTFPLAGKVFPFETIFKKHDGKYLLYHDEFEFSS